MKAHLLAFLGAAVIGAAGVRLLAPGPPPSPPAPSQGAAPLSPPALVARQDCADDGERVERIEALHRELTEAERTVAVASAQAEVETGAPLDWPSDLTEPFTETGLERALTSMLDAAGVGELVGLDCGEYPCVGIITLTGEDAFEDRSALDEHLDNSLYAGLMHRSESLHMTPEGGIASLTLRMAFPARTLEGGGIKRTGFRMDEAQTTFEADIAALVKGDDP